MSVFFGVVIAIGWLFSRLYGNSSILYIAVFFSIFMNVLSYWFSDKIVLMLHRARPLDAKSHPELYQIVARLVSLAGLPMPKLYIIDDPAPNAFATGRNSKHAVVAVTSGILERLSPAELEGVLSHELSHIGNRDMLVSTVAVVLVGFVSILSDIFMRSMLFGGWAGRDDDRDRGAGGFILVIGIIFSILASLIASLIHLAISRRRELLADSSGALLTRAPQNLASALGKIASYSRPLSSAKNATAHLFFGNPFGADRSGLHKTSWIIKMFSTHPPIEERIAALEQIKV
ncbi:MAG: M48 family metalloprotease [Candidatus Sungiibacteriota bacterium]|uniref:Protease HtpX homolog n=1 Tax=Candidatus Sungiibacteriota bacterium TaxID=2750080 RepID=A0A7T5UR41_9BACT|nr:MAG: M48 family metalloprotease [Candidatus Sungbacteria bacterium]